MRAILTLLFLVLGTTAEAKKDPLPVIEMALIGPKKITVNPTEAQKIRLIDDAQYEMAKEFGSNYGKKFLDLVISRLSRHTVTNILIDLSSAEHLGTLLELGLAAQNQLDRVHIHYVDLSAEKIRTWRAVKIGENHLLRTGLGPIPDGWEQEYAIPHGSVQELADSLRDLNLTDRRVLVIDNGLEGAATEAVAAVKRFWRPGEYIEIEGIQLAQAAEYTFEATIPIHVLAALSGPSKPDIEGWAWMFSTNTVQRQKRFAGEHIFQKSSGIGSRPDRALENYKATLLGLYDGLADACNSALKTTSQSETRSTLR
jgi:hypothetical protein